MSQASFVRLVVVLALIACTAVGVTGAVAGRFGPAPGQHSGYIDIPEQKPGNGGHIFYWMFEAESEPLNAPVVLWMTGGPGCSSELAVFYEQGPYRLADDGTVSQNPYRWSKDVNIIFVDQPVGTGFSWADKPNEYVTNEKEVAQDMYQFLQGFFKEFPQLLSNPFFVTGESYAGHYVPSVSYRIWQGIQNSEGARINMQGLAIGNGLVNPPVQYNDYGPYAFDNKLISWQQYASINETLAVCEAEIKAGLGVLAVGTCNSIIGTIQAEGGNFNVYNIKQKCTYPPLCYNFSPLATLMNNATVQQMLGIAPQASQWASCANAVHIDLTGDWLTNCEVNIPEMLDKAGWRVLVYSGQLDFICNWYGGRDWTNKMPWSGQKQFLSQTPQKWLNSDGRYAGIANTVGNFTFLGVAEAGHMVPMDQPQNALEMLLHFVTGYPFY